MDCVLTPLDSRALTTAAPILWLPVRNVISVIASMSSLALGPFVEFPPHRLACLFQRIFVPTASGKDRDQALPEGCWVNPLYHWVNTDSQIPCGFQSRWRKPVACLKLRPPTTRKSRTGHSFVCPRSGSSVNILCRISDE